MGVKVYPMQEQVMSNEPFQNIMKFVLPHQHETGIICFSPWYFMYQPVSYQLQGRMGSRDELRAMIQTCRQVRIQVALT